MKLIQEKYHRLSKSQHHCTVEPSKQVISLIIYSTFYIIITINPYRAGLYSYIFKSNATRKKPWNELSSIKWHEMVTLETNIQLSS